MTRGFLLCFVSVLLMGQQAATPKKAVTGDQRVDDLLRQMTLDEKISLIHGAAENAKEYQGQAGYLPGVPRLGVPGLRFADGPPGVLTRHPALGETATMGVAATFSVKDAEENGAAIGRQARALGIDVALQPFVNIDRDLEFARGYNTFGEDPFLTSMMGVAEVQGIQAQHVMAQIKHYIAYDSDSGNIFVDDQTLHEVYLAPFEAAAKAGVASLMCSYNRLNGTFACGNRDSLITMLRDQVGFTGFVTSDWGAVHGVGFINAGLDMEMPGEATPGASFAMPSFFDLKPLPPPPPPGAMGDMMAAFFSSLPEEPKPAPMDMGDFGTMTSPERMQDALKSGAVTEEAITKAAGHVLLQIVRFGYMDGQQKHSVTDEPIEENAKVVRQTGEDAAVLLKNDGPVLPLTAADLDSVVLIGPTAGQVDSIGMSGERSVGLASRMVGPLAAMKSISGNAHIQFAVADDMTGETIPAAALSHADGKTGLVRADGSEKTDAAIRFTVKDGTALPANSTITWKGMLTPPHAGNYWLYLQALGTNAAVSIDGKKLLRTGAMQGGVHGDILQANQDNVTPTTDGLDNVRRALELAAGPHAIEVNITPDTSNAPVQLRLNWYTPEQRTADHEAAVAAAKKAGKAIVFVWTRQNPVFGLPGDQNKLVEEVAAVNPNTVVVLNTSQPVALPWLSQVKGVLEMWWPGDEGGWASADVLLGKVSPAGRLPITWAKRLEDYAATDPKHPERSKAGVDKKTTYSEGVHVGYRWFDKENIEPLFAFGYGLSYTTFEYSGLKAKKAADGGLAVRFRVKNTGPVDSDDVPQVYLSAPKDAPKDVQFPVRALAAFERVHVRAGETKSVSLHVGLRQMQYWSTKEAKWLRTAGDRTLSVGGSSRDLPLTQMVK